MAKRAFFLSVAIAISLIFSFLLWSPSAAAYSENQRILLQSWRIVNQAYLDETFNHQNWWFVRQNYLKKPLKKREDTYSAIEEMLASLNDPFTRLLRPEQYRSLQVSTSGELSGVGLQIDIDQKTGELEVVAPIAGSPAEEAGIAPRDRILAIDGLNTANLTLDEAALRMRGESGTKVTLTVQSPGKDNLHEVEIIREIISLNSVYAKLDTESGTVPIGYLRLSQFSANSTAEMKEAIADLEAKGAKAYILDLRSNPGGLLTAGIEIARLWLNNATVVYTVNRQGMLGSFDAYDGAITDDPLIVLVNQGTASASEILAGALQDNKRAQLVGEKTFGKGLIQSLFELPDGSGLAVTVAKYETPKHKDIHKLGISPDYKIHQDPITLKQATTELDLQYQTAVKLLNPQSVVADAA
ncbi:carboxyl-terminal processing protease CtpA [Oscillatoria salina]|uniref:carboxyl-terminal processing protease CtpA n=1 Tax=Oscillatoria salina TaxID=331517 RepID=UPI0013B80250|nr:carboxyl-terminal processing protease CtpA [Oscillatoria salina]MBZ8180699.1 PDZ domain-containing protein [Oscillatoria salina IIICB1]NET87565.1 PDZ domain-containing protein [Kamptonema sp. SIO1D9]